MRCIIRWVVYPDLTDNSRAGKSSTIVSFHHGERRRRYGTEPVIVPTPPGRSRVDGPHGACLVAWSSNSHAPDVPQAKHTPTVVYPTTADNISGPLSIRLRRAN